MKGLGPLCSRARVIVTSGTPSVDHYRRALCREEERGRRATAPLLSSACLLGSGGLLAPSFWLGRSRNRFGLLASGTQAKPLGKLRPGCRIVGGHHGIVVG